MIAKELFEKYNELFILVIETAGQNNKNKVYMKVKDIIEKNKEQLDRAVEDDIPFNVYVALLSFLVVKEVHGFKKLEEIDNDELNNLVNSMFEMYLKKPTRKFTATYGLPIINSLDTYLEIISYKIKN